MTDTQILLAEYVRTGSETAFGELVRRYLNLVYSTALRLVGGDTHLAEDVAQTVFVHLARKARSLSNGSSLGGWLHRDTCYAARTVMRGVRRRLSRERLAVEMNALQDHSESNLARVAPILDEVINQLDDDDRTAILLRFFEQRDFRSVGQALGSHEDAARMRVNRALEKLHTLLKHRGVAFSAAALGTALAGEAITAAPAGLAAAIAGAALAGAASSTGTGLTLLKLMSMTKTGIIGAIAVAAVMTPLAVQHQNQVRLREENRALHGQLDGLPGLAAENLRLSNLVAQANQSLSDEQKKELLKLRGEVGLLRRRVRELETVETQNRRLQAALANTAQHSQEPKQESPADEQQQAGIAKMNDAKLLVLGLILYADKNQGRTAASLDQVLPYLRDSNDPTGDTRLTLTGTNQFDLVYQGVLNAITNPASTIVLREKEAWQAVNGNWERTYGFADGHTEVRSAPNGDFAAWERQHMMRPAGGGQ